MTVSFATLMGAAVFNNTLVLFVVLMIILLRGLAWRFTAETIAVLFVEYVLVLVVLVTNVHTVRLAVMVLMLWPSALLIVALLETQAGLQ